MPRPPSPDLRRQLVERAAAMLAAREPVTLRALVAGTGASTMAVYTYFDGMPGLWRAVRQEGFTRLGERLARLAPTSDPVHDLAGLGAAYLAHALAHPALYRAMFDGVVELEDPAAADASFGRLVEAATRAREAGRFSRDSDPLGVATRYWAVGHGLASLAVGGILPADGLHEQAAAAAEALCTAAGDRPARCRASVERGWAAGLAQA